MNRKVNLFIEAVVCLLYFMVVYLSLKASFLHMEEVEAQLGDGIYYLLLDIVCFFLFINGLYRYGKLPRVIIPFLLFVLFQFFFLYLAGMPIEFILRLDCWGIVFLGLFYYGWTNNTDDIINVFAIGLFALACFTAFSEISIRQLENQYGINEVYWVELGLPVLYLCNKRYLQYAIAISVSAAVLLSMKATGISALVIGFIVAEWTKTKIFSQSSKRLFRIMGLLFLALIIFYFANNYLMSNFGLDWSDKYETSLETGGSGRFELWGKAIGLIGSSSISQIFLGHGHNSLIRVLGFSAHNDFIEVFYDYGLIMLVLYISIYICLFKEWHNMIRVRSEVAIAFGFSIVLFFIMSMFSHLVIYPGLLISLAAIWAICITRYRCNL